MTTPVSREVYRVEAKIRSYLDFDNYEWATRTVHNLRRMTGDQCYLRFVSQRYWTVVRYDAAGREVGVNHGN